MGDTAWKRHERIVAKALEVDRFKRGADFSRSLPDVVAPAENLFKEITGTIIVECKYRHQIGIIDTYLELVEELESPVFIMESRKSGKEYLIFDILDIPQFSEIKSVPTIVKFIPNYILDALSQSEDYLENYPPPYIKATCFAKKRGKARPIIIPSKDLDDAHTVSLKK